MGDTVHLTAVCFKIGEQAAPLAAPSQPMRRQRRPTLASAVKAAKRAGADRVEIDPRNGRIVIPLAGNSVESEGDTEGENPWDVVLPGGRNAARKPS
jgi:hypothetical protein